MRLRPNTMTFARVKDLTDLIMEEYAQVDKDKMPCNKPRRLNDGSNSSHIVKACYPGAPEGGKIIRLTQAKKVLAQLASLRRAKAIA